MMVTVFYGLITLMFRVNPPPIFLRVKFGKKSGGNTRVNTVLHNYQEYHCHHIHAKLYPAFVQCVYIQNDLQQGDALSDCLSALL
jgi:hypothetical protein